MAMPLPAQSANHAAPAFGMPNTCEEARINVANRAAWTSSCGT